jgi:hypothetical protein
MIENIDDKPKADSHPLGYATHVGEYPQLQTHPRFVVLLIALTALGGVWSIILGAMSLGDAWKFGLLLIGAGLCLCAATLGKLSAKSLRLRAAILLLTLGIAIYVPVIVIADRLFKIQNGRYASDLAAQQSDSRHLPTEAESEVFMYAMVRDCAAISSLLGLGCGVYAGIRLVARRGNDFA